MAIIGHPLTHAPFKARGVSIKGICEISGTNQLKPNTNTGVITGLATEAH